MCVEVWPHQWMKNSFTIIILCIQYLLPLIVLPLVHSQVQHFQPDMAAKLQLNFYYIYLDSEFPGEKFRYCSG